MNAQQLSKLGWCLEDSTDQSILSTKDVKRALLDTDLKEIGKSVFTDELKRGHYCDLLENSISLPFISQICRVVNASAPKADPDSKSAPRILRVLLTDGHTAVTGVEMEPIAQLSLNTPPGTKAKLHNSVKIDHGMLLLNNGNFTILGGNVQTLVENWKLKKSLDGSVRRKNQIGGPPTWVPFGHRIDKASIKPGMFKSFDEARGAATSQTTGDGEDDFELARKANIAEVLDQQTKDSDQARNDVLSNQASRNMSVRAPPPSNPQNLLSSYVRPGPPGSQNSLPSSSADSTRSSGSRKPRGKRGEDIGDPNYDDGHDPKSTRPSATATLFDFLQPKFSGSKQRPASSSSTSSSNQYSSQRHHDSHQPSQTAPANDIPPRMQHVAMASDRRKGNQSASSSSKRRGGTGMNESNQITAKPVNTRRDKGSAKSGRESRSSNQSTDTNSSKTSTQHASSRSTRTAQDQQLKSTQSSNENVTKSNRKLDGAKESRANQKKEQTTDLKVANKANRPNLSIANRKEPLKPADLPTRDPNDLNPHAQDLSPDLEAAIEMMAAMPPRLPSSHFRPAPNLPPNPPPPPQVTMPVSAVNIPGFMGLSSAPPPPQNGTICYAQPMPMAPSMAPPLMQVQSTVSMPVQPQLPPPSALNSYPTQRPMIQQGTDIALNTTEYLESEKAELRKQKMAGIEDSDVLHAAGYQTLLNGSAATSGNVSSFSTNPSEQLKPKPMWKVGDFCMAPWTDGYYYKAIIQATSSESRNILVSYIEYDDALEVDSRDILICNDSSMHDQQQNEIHTKPGLLGNAPPYIPTGPQAQPPPSSSTSIIPGLLPTPVFQSSPAPQNQIIVNRLPLPPNTTNRPMGAAGFSPSVCPTLDLTATGFRVEKPVVHFS